MKGIIEFTKNNILMAGFNSARPVSVEVMHPNNVIKREVQFNLGHLQENRLAAAEELAKRLKQSREFNEHPFDKMEIALEQDDLNGDTHAAPNTYLILTLKKEYADKVN